MLTDNIICTTLLTINLKEQIKSLFSEREKIVFYLYKKTQAYLDVSLNSLEKCMCLILTQDTLHRPPAKEIRLEDHCDYK